MPQVLQQAVGDVDGGPRPAHQGGAQIQREHGPGQVAGAHRGTLAGLPVTQPQTALPGHAADRQALAGAGAVAAQRTARRHRAGGLDAHAQRPTGNVTADQRDAGPVRQIEHALGEAGQPGLVGLRQRHRQQEPQRARAHGVEIGQIHRQAAMAHIGGGQVVGEVVAAEAGVQGHYQLVAGGREQQGRVVAGAQHHAIARRVVRAAEVAFYQSEFIHNQTLPLLCHGQSLSAPSSSGACRDAAGRWAVSAERSRRASLSSTPLTYLKESSAPNTLASSMLSLITTR